MFYLSRPERFQQVVTKSLKKQITITIQLIHAFLNKTKTNKSWYPRDKLNKINLLVGIKCDKLAYTK